MIAFLIELDNRAGTVAEVTEAIADRGINIIGGAGVGGGAKGYFAVTTNDEAGTRHVLIGASYKFREIEVMPLTLADTPGAFARACRALADAKINIDAAFPMAGGGERNTIAFATDDPIKTRSILSQKTLATSSH
jgi:hypothetical protein